MNDKNGVLGKRLKLHRAKYNKSQEEVSKAIDVSRARYSHYENNHVEPDIEVIKKLADYYNVSSDYLLGITNSVKGNNNESKTNFTVLHNDIDNTDQDTKMIEMYLQLMTPEQRRKARILIQTAFDDLLKS
ncbi:helix-turn-helix domain-containing protein [Virgibacillus necropolis]|uniref:helix-turn-helix domain-containing protein n=1 Tax=Virgibacillus necropolis TaxID=163877 RepID=UPI00384D3636